MVEFGSCPYWVFTKLRVDIMDVITKCSLLKILPSSLFVSTVNPLFIIQLKKKNEELKAEHVFTFSSFGRKRKTLWSLLHNVQSNIYLFISIYYIFISPCIYLFYYLL